MMETSVLVTTRSRRRFHHGHHHRRHHHHIRVALIVNDEFAVELIPNGVIHMATTMKVGQSTVFTIAYLDILGVPMVTPPTPDATPAWSQIDATIESLLAAADGLSATAVGLDGGAKSRTDTVQVQLMVGGLPFSATIDSTVEAVVQGQTLGSIQIVAGTPTGP